MTTPTNGTRTAVVVAGVAVLVFIVAGLVARLATAGSLDDDSTPLVTMILGLIGVTIPSLIALAKVEETRRDVEETRHDLENGLVTDKVREALDSYDTEHNHQSQAGLHRESP